ncbi:MAG: hypothetical protein Q4P35_05515 [Clostridia bacterium]|nr:hypothetical protein [Clostridia bacterium]
MRVAPEFTYPEYKVWVMDAFRLLKNNVCKTADEVTDYMANEDDDLFVEGSTSLAIWIVTIGEYEVRHDILEERVHTELCYHIPRFLDGLYDDDLTEEEHKQMQEDVDYILSKIELYKVVPIEED